MKVDWGKFGKYEFKFNAEAKSMEGNAVPKSDDDKNWRNAAFKGPIRSPRLSADGLWHGVRGRVQRAKD